MNIADIMSRDVITAGKETSLEEAAGLLAKFRIHGIPIVDGENKVVGIVTESDFFTKDASNIFLPTFLDFVRSGNKKALDKFDSGEIGNKTKVEDIMTADCVTVRQDTTVEDAIKLFKKNTFNSMPVTDEQGVLVGIVTIMDVIKLL